MSKVYYIDPQSYNNLSVYDYKLLSHVQGHEIIYYYCDQYQLKDYPAKISRCRFHYNKYNNSLLKAISYFFTMVGIYIDVCRECPNIVHIQWIRLYYIDYMFAWLLKRRGTKVVFTAHNILPHVPSRFDHSHYRGYYSLVDSIIVHDHKTRDDLSFQMQVKKSKIHVIHHGILDTEVSELDLINRKNQLCKDLNITSDQLVFSCLGVHKPYKGTQEVVNVWSSTPELYSNPKCKLLIIGRRFNIDYSPVSSLNNVYILEKMVSDLDFEAYLSLSSVVMLTYHKISQSGLLFSAVNRGVPVMISEVGGMPEVLSVGKIGWNIGAMTEENLHRCLKTLIENPQEIEDCRNNKSAFMQVRKSYDWSSIGQCTSKMYASI